MPDHVLDLLTGGLLGLGWWELAAVALVLVQLTIFSVTLYLHRSQAHRGVDFHPVLAHGFRFWLWLTTSMITREWVAIHRKHHARVETEDDPHSPQVRGIGQVFWRGVELYREARAQRADIDQYGRGTPDDWIERRLYTPHANLGPTLLLFIEAALFGLPGIALWAIQMAWIPFWAAGVVNGLGHWWGYRNVESADTSTNLVPWAVWIGGEELHNNHHAFPGSERFSMRRWELYIGWVVIRLLQALRLATVLRVAPRMDIRPDVAVADADTLKALLSHRFQAMTDFQRNVLTPALRDEARAAGARLRKLLPGRWSTMAAGSRRRAAPNCSSGWHARRASGSSWSIARGWPPCWNPAATTPPSGCANCSTGARRRRPAAWRRCRPTRPGSRATPRRRHEQGEGACASQSCA